MLYRRGLLGLISLGLVLAVPESVCAQDSSAQRQKFLEMFARAYFPGRSGQIMLVPREGDIITRDDPAYRYMHGSPWDYDSRVPLLFFGAPYVRQGVYRRPAAHQDIVPTLAALLRLPLPPVVTGKSLSDALNLSAGQPKVIFLAVLDAMRLDYFECYRSQLPTLTRLREKGAWYTEARANYLPTATAVAHATIATGTDPRIHGINVNSMYDRNRRQAVNPFPEGSPENLMALTLADLWTLETDRQALIMSQGSLLYAASALIGRGAFLLNGRTNIAIAYNQGDGKWQATKPGEFLLPLYLEERTSRDLWSEAGGTWMGHDIASPSAVRRSALFARFEADALISMIENEPIGADQVSDLVLVNLKTPDFVGHQFGPDSPEIRETVAELDRQLSRILEALDKKVGAGGYLVVITADHGMPAEPAQGRRHFSEDIVQMIHSRFDPQGKLILHYEPSNSQLMVDRKRLQQLGLALSEIRDFLASQAGIYAAFTEEELQRTQLP